MLYYSRLHVDRSDNDALVKAKGFKFNLVLSCNFSRNSFICAIGGSDASAATTNDSFFLSGPIIQFCQHALTPHLFSTGPDLSLCCIQHHPSWLLKPVWKHSQFIASASLAFCASHWSGRTCFQISSLLIFRNFWLPILTVLSVFAHLSLHTVEIAYRKAPR